MVEAVIVEIASGTKTVRVTVAVMIEVLKVVLTAKIVVFVETRFDTVMVLVVTDLMYSTQLTNVGYAAGEFPPLSVFFLLTKFLLGARRPEMSRLFLFGTYPLS